MITRATGPECPKCGCNDCPEVAQKQWFGKLLSYRDCSHCYNRFAAEMPAIDDQALDVPAPSGTAPRMEHGVVQYEANPVRCRCPKCEADNPPVKKTIPRDGGGAVRYHKCGCGHTFKSLESK